MRLHCAIRLLNDGLRDARHGIERGFYLDVLACGVFAASQNVPGAPARARQCRPTGRRAQGIFGAERPSTRGATAPQRAQQVKLVS